LASDLFSIKLLSDGLVRAQMGTGAVKTTIALSTTDWTQVTVSFIIQTFRSNANLIAIYLNGVNNIMNYALTVGTVTFAPTTDVVRIGGPGSFLGSLKGLSIYSPGSLHVDSRIFY